MFGLGFGELCVIIIVALVVIGPRDLPKVMRKAGQWAGKLRRMAADARQQSGIDDILKDSSIGADLHEIRKLARGELDGVAKAISGASATKDEPVNDSHGALHSHGSSHGHSYRHDDPYESSDAATAREREYPRDGADSYRALPDTALAYGNGYPSSAFATDPLYAEGDINAPPRKKSPPPLETAPIEDVKAADDLKIDEAKVADEDLKAADPIEAPKNEDAAEAAKPEALS